MTKKKFQELCFLRLYSVDFSAALHTIKVLGRYSSLEVRIPLIRDIVTTYGRPFSGNKSELIPVHKLSSKDHVPEKHRDLHRELMRLRNEQFAHTDCLFYKPEISKFSGKGGLSFPMSFRGYSYPDLISRVSEIGDLIRSVEISIKSAIGEFERAL